MGSLSQDTDAADHRWILIPCDQAGAVTVGVQAESSWSAWPPVPQQLQAARGRRGRHLLAAGLSRMTENGCRAARHRGRGGVVQLNQNSRYGLYFVYDFSANHRQALRLGPARVLLLSHGGAAALVGTIIWYVTREVVRPVSNTARVLPNGCPRETSTCAVQVGPTRWRS
ncbi:hypothetical protein QJS66_22630 [Kocuria rhizophila]|nr:hypothetical protein QJS66_22630 [Kocuria rhizophila]